MQKIQNEDVSNGVTSSEIKALQDDEKQDIEILPLEKQAVEFPIDRKTRAIKY